jgi:RsiW-degrading membrane proteinase PrsW (M82 family)
MNEETQKLLQQLAEKLGTTVEHLWQVLIAQARVEAITHSIIFASLFVVIVALWAFLISKEFKDDDGDVVVVVCGFLAGGTLLYFLILCLEITNIVTGFYNPEYFALKQVLRQL